MGECCTNSKNPEERKIFESFENIKPENINELNILNYDEKSEEIKSIFRNAFDKLGRFQQIRVNFIKELKKDITNNDLSDVNYFQYYPPITNNLYENTNYTQNIKNFNINENQRTLYHIIIMTLILKVYLTQNYISNELEISLLELSVIIMNKQYEKRIFKIILFYISKMFEILFPNLDKIQNFLNLKEYLSKISLITEDVNILTKEEKYLFIKTHIISLGEWFHNDYKSILIDKLFRFLLLKYYSYLYVQNFDFIIQNEYNYQKTINQSNNKIIEYNENYYNENDLIQIDNPNNGYEKKLEDLKKISFSIHYFFIICTEDIFTGKNIFLDFSNMLQQEIINQNLQNDFNLIKFRKSLFHIIFGNILKNDYSTTMLISFLDYIIEYQKIGIEDSDTYHQMILNLYGRFNNNRIFLDKYSLFVSKSFIMEIEKNQKNNLILDELYKYINDTNKYNNEDSGNIMMKNYENIYFFINIIKDISIYYNKQKNITIAYNILIYLILLL